MTAGASALRTALPAAVAALVLSLAPLSAAFASGLDRLNAFMTGTHSARADFTQRIVDHNGKQVQQSGGTLEFARPGKFRWVYAKPYSQTIVGDGEKVWIFDPDLNQVTVRKLDVALGSTPAALLAGNNDALKSFTLADDGDKDGVQWVLATPHDKNSQFTHIRLGFAASGIQAMELEDSLGQKTTLQFSNFAANPRLDPGTFHFSPPKGADVVGG
jgi:outer membrane lipoprotein carrier protein